MQQNLSGGALRILLVNNHSINVVGNIWEPRKFTRYYTLKRQVNVCAIA